MPLVNFRDLMTAAEAGNYAVGYFESWDLASLMAVADAAELARSPVILGFSGLYLTHQDRLLKDPLSTYAAMGLEVCSQLSVPATLLFNESPDEAAVLEAAGLGFGLVMYSDESLDAITQQNRVKVVVKRAHELGAAVEGEIASLPGVAGTLTDPLSLAPLTTVEAALDFVNETGVDALGVNLGQMHLHGRQKLDLDLVLLDELRQALPVPLVFHGATSVRRDHLSAAARSGIRKINVGSLLKSQFFETLREACNDVGDRYNPYQVVGSGLQGDVMVTARLALRDVVVDLMNLFGSAGKACARSY